MNQDNHCVDCCCAQSWKALGITTYTGKSIPEEITTLKLEISAKDARIKELEDECDNLTGQLISTQAQLGASIQEYELNLEIRDKVQETYQRVCEGWQNKFDSDMEKLEAYVARLEQAYKQSQASLIWEQIDRDQLGLHYKNPDAPWMSSKEKGELIEKRVLEALEKIRSDQS